jgi:hypothetical protein
MIIEFKQVRTMHNYSIHFETNYLLAKIPSTKPYYIHLLSFNTHTKLGHYAMLEL